MVDHESHIILLWRDAWIQSAEVTWTIRKRSAEEWQGAVDTLENSADLKYERGIISLMHGLLAFKRGEYQKALSEMEGANCLVETDDLMLWQARAWMLKGIIQGASGLLDQGLSAWRKALIAAKSIDDRESMLLCSYNIAVGLRTDTTEIEEAEAYFQDALKFATEKEPHHVITANIYSGLSKCALVIGNKEQAINYADYCMAEAQSQGEANAIGWALENYCDLYLKLGELESALAYGLRNLDYWQEMKQDYAKAVADLDLALIYGALAEHEKAIHYGNDALDALTKLQSTMLIDKLYEQLMNSYEAVGMFPDALKASQNLIKAKAEKSKHEVQREVARAAAIQQVEMAKRDAEIHRLRHVELQEKNEQLEDLTIELKQTLEHLRGVQAELIRQEKLAGLVSLIGGVAHEMNTPLGNSITLTSFLEHQHRVLFESYCNEAITPVQLQNYFDDLDEILPSLHLNLDKTAAIINSFKLIAVNPKPMNRVSVSMCELLNEWKSSIIINFPHFSGVVDCQCIDEITLTIDREVLCTLLDELLRNTIMHGYQSEDTTSVHVCIRLEKAPLLQKTLLIFEDFGCGIKEVHLKRIFEPFYTDRKTTSGLGLGLHMVYNLAVLLLGGTIAIESQIDGGTQVKLCFED